MIHDHEEQLLGYCIRRVAGARLDGRRGFAWLVGTPGRDRWLCLGATASPTPSVQVQDLLEAMPERIAADLAIRGRPWNDFTSVEDAVATAD
jgi:hypothetical protein